MIQYYCIPSCDKCRKARKWLNEKALEYQEIDMRKDGVPVAVIEGWIERYGMDAILNRKSTTWRQLDDELKAKLDSAPVEVINSNPAMLSRPLLDFGDQLLTGKDALSWLDNA